MLFLLRTHQIGLIEISLLGDALEHWSLFFLLDYVY